VQLNHQTEGPDETFFSRLLGDLPYSFYRAINEGSGTANAIKATNGYPMASTNALIVFNVTDTNTSDSRKFSKWLSLTLQKTQLSSKLMP
jgi:hypothetical protein